VFVSPKGSPHAHFQRALERRHLISAEAAARQLGRLSLADALALCLLIAAEDPVRFDRAAARWHARFVLEAGRIGLGESHLALAAVAALPGPARLPAAETLRDLARRYRVANVDSALRH
jgi:hypothetical protein